MKQIRLAIESNTGGSGKTTLSTHLAYVLGKKGYRVVLIELDANNSLSLFTGVPQIEADEVENSAAALFEKQFKGNYPEIPIWTDHLDSVSLIRGGPPLDDASRGLHLHKRPYEILRHRFEDYPIDADIIIMDTPASLDPMGLIALAASTHLLVAIKPEFKDSSSSARLLEWFYAQLDELRLKPQPEILGFVPSRVNLNLADHRNLMGVDRKGNRNTDLEPANTIPGQLEELGIQCFPMIRESGYFLSASGTGLPIHIYRPGDKATKSFDPIANELIKLLKQR